MLQQDKSSAAVIKELIEQIEVALQAEDFEACKAIAEKLHIEVQNFCFEKSDDRLIEAYYDLVTALINKVAIEKERVKKDLLKYQNGKKVAYAYKKL